MDAARKLRNRAAYYMLRNSPNNTNKLRESKQKFRSALKVYSNGGRTYKNGKQIGTLVTNGFFIYSEIPRKTRVTSDFKMGLKNGAKASFMYWIPGMVTRDTLRGLNIGGLFKEKTPVSKSPRRTPGRSAKSRKPV